jgi:hypothetical protein
MTEGETSNQYEKGLHNNVILNMCTLMCVTLCSEFTSLKQLKSRSTQLIVWPVLLPLNSYMFQKHADNFRLYTFYNIGFILCQNVFVFSDTEFAILT